MSDLDELGTMTGDDLDALVTAVTRQLENDREQRATAAICSAVRCFHFLLAELPVQVQAGEPARELVQYTYSAMAVYFGVFAQYIERETVERLQTAVGGSADAIGGDVDFDPTGGGATGNRFGTSPMMNTGGVSPMMATGTPAEVSGGGVTNTFNFYGYNEQRIKQVIDQALMQQGRRADGLIRTRVKT